MITKQFTPKKTVCKVTFSVPAEKVNEKAAVLGDFNNWDASEGQLVSKDGVWETTLRLDPNTQYKFRYLLDGSVWENDEQADGYVPNEFGTEDSIVDTTI